MSRRTSWLDEINKFRTASPPIVFIKSRVHDRDAAVELKLQGHEYVHINLPMEYE